MYDTVITSGTIIDGTNFPRYRADIGIKDGRIAKIGRIAPDEGAKGCCQSNANRSLRDGRRSLRAEASSR